MKREILEKERRKRTKKELFGSILQNSKIFINNLDRTLPRVANKDSSMECVLIFGSFFSITLNSGIFGLKLSL